MSAIEFITNGGIASVAGDLPEEYKKIANRYIKKFNEKVRQYAIQLQASASLLKVRQCTYLLVAKDTIGRVLISV